MFYYPRNRLFISPHPETIVHNRKQKFDRWFKIRSRQRPWHTRHDMSSEVDSILNRPSRCSLFPGFKFSAHHGDICEEKPIQRTDQWKSQWINNRHISWQDEHQTFKPILHYTKFLMSIYSMDTEIKLQTDLKIRAPTLYRAIPC